MPNIHSSYRLTCFNEAPAVRGGKLGVEGMVEGLVARLQ